tara:strand:+ start:301 stop:549 length:249 start_codon:yes stop_codon:yes gene_type:complete
MVGPARIKDGAILVTSFESQVLTKEELEAYIEAHEPGDAPLTKLQKRAVRKVREAEAQAQKDEKSNRVIARGPHAGSDGDGD